MLKKLVKPMLFSLAAGISSTALASTYPEHPIRIVVPYAPGSTGDLAIRQIQPLLTEELGQPIIIENKSGAGGNIGAQYVARAKPDGYTLLLGATNNFVINQFLFTDLGYDPLIDLDPITKVVYVPAFIYINAEVPAKNFAEFKDYAQRHPGQLNYGTPGAGTTPALSGWMLSEAIQGDMIEVSYRGSPPGVLALLANEVQVYIGGYGIASSHLESEKLRALAVALPERYAELPEVPTTKEVGIEDVVLSNWWGLAAPANTDPAILTQLEHALHTVLQNTALQKALSTQGFVVTSSTAQQFKEEMQSEASYWQTIIQKANLEVN